MRIDRVVEQDRASQFADLSACCQAAREQRFPTALTVLDKLEEKFSAEQGRVTGQTDRDTSALRKLGVTESIKDLVSPDVILNYRQIKALECAIIEIAERPNGSGVLEVMAVATYLNSCERQNPLS